MTLEDQFNDDLKQCKTMQDVFNVVGHYYDLNNTKLGTFNKIVVISGIKQSIKLLNPPLK